MLDLLIAWVVFALSVYAVAAILPGVRVGGVGSSFVVAAVFGLLNVLVGWLLFVVLGIATLGLGFVFTLVTRWVVTSILLKITDALLSSFYIRDFFPTALIAGGLIALLSTFLERVAVALF
jgi:putative membrane protein